MCSSIDQAEGEPAGGPPDPNPAERIMVELAPGVRRDSPLCPVQRGRSDCIPTLVRTGRQQAPGFVSGQGPGQTSGERAGSSRGSLPRHPFCPARGGRTPGAPRPRARRESAGSGAQPGWARPNLGGGRDSPDRPEEGVTTGCLPTSTRQGVSVAGVKPGGAWPNPGVQTMGGMVCWQRWLATCQTPGSPQELRPSIEPSRASWTRVTRTSAEPSRSPGCQ